MDSLRASYFRRLVLLIKCRVVMVRVFLPLIEIKVSVDSWVDSEQVHWRVVENNEWRGCRCWVRVMLMCSMMNCMRDGVKRESRQRKRQSFLAYCLRPILCHVVTREERHKIASWAPTPCTIEHMGSGKSEEGRWRTVISLVSRLHFTTSPNGFLDMTPSDQWLRPRTLCVIPLLSYDQRFHGMWS